MSANSWVVRMAERLVLRTAVTKVDGLADLMAVSKESMTAGRSAACWDRTMAVQTADNLVVLMAVWKAAQSVAYSGKTSAVWLVDS